MQYCIANELKDFRDFIFIRHGHTPWNPTDISKGFLDLKLDETGQYQATQAYTIVKEHLIDCPIIYSSHLQRAHETANIFANKFIQTPQIILKEDLQERYYGDSKITPLKNSKLNAESNEIFQQRVCDVLREIFEQTPKNIKNIIIVSHQKVFEFLTEWLSGNKLRLNNGGVCHFKFVSK